MIEKIIGAFTFKPGVYAEVKKDAGFTGSAWLIVAITSLLSSIGTGAITSHGRFWVWLLGALFTAVFAVAGFALACLVITWVGKTVFNTTASFNEIVRPLGLARVWHIVGVLGLLALITPALGCVTGIFSFTAGILGFIAWLIAAREALGLEWPQTIATVVLGMMVVILVSVISGLVLGAFGLATAALLGAFRG
jgi:hypothetical protein